LKEGTVSVTIISLHDIKINIVDPKKLVAKVVLDD
jgi:hypothetical protein